MESETQILENLKALIQKWNHEYYVLGQPTVSDEEYDRVFEELRALDPSYISVGSDLSTTTPLTEVPHLTPLLSLDKIYTIADLQKWIEKISPARFSIEPKIDGVSLSLIYKNGKLDQALTRGDGYKGLDVTHNVRHIVGIPHVISSQETYAFRGEIFMTHENFHRQKEQTLYANPRNLASGMLRRLDLSPKQASFLNLYIYQGTRFPEDFASHEEMWEFLIQNHFPVPPDVHFFDSQDDITSLIEELQMKRKTLPFDIDGLVLKVSDITLRKSLGETNHHPKWAMALKFSPPTSLSEVLDITIHVGRTGKITPLALLKPVLIQGSTVKKATLHNKSTIELLEIGIGDVVSISKRGDIIPAIEQVVEKKGPLWKFPSVCPSCQTPLIADGANEFCPQADCPDKVRAQLLYFVKTLDMQGFGESLIALLYEKFHLRKPEDFWEISWDHLLDLEGFGLKKIQKLKMSLNNTPQNTSFGTLLMAIGIPEISKNVVSLLFQAQYTSLESWFSFREEDLLVIKGLGAKTIQRLLVAFSPSSTWVQTLQQLHHNGFSLSQASSSTSESNNSSLPLSGTIWVITGTFEHYQPRSQVFDDIQNLGGKVASSVTQSTTHVLYGEHAGKKLQQAEKYPQILLISEEEFRKNYVLIHEDGLFS